MLSLSRVVNHPLFNFAFFMGIRQVTKRLPLEDPTYLWSLRILYVVCQFIAVGMNYWLIWKVNKKNGKFPFFFILRWEKKKKKSVQCDELRNGCKGPTN